MFNKLISIRITRPVDGQWETINLNKQEEIALFLEKGAQAFAPDFSLDHWEHMIKLTIETGDGELVTACYD